MSRLLGRHGNLRLLKLGFRINILKEHYKLLSQWEYNYRNHTRTGHAWS